MPPAERSITRTVNFQANRTQLGFIKSRATADLFSSRRGEGKSTALAWSIYDHTRQNPGARWACVRDTFENLRKTTMSTFFEWFPPGVFGNYHTTNKEWTWAEGAAQGSVLFMGMDDPKDATNFQSLELAGVVIDEPSPSVASGSVSAGIDEIVMSLGISSLRQPGMQWYAMKLAQNNPDESHWTYKRFVDPGTPGYAMWQPLDPENIHNLPSSYYEMMRTEFEAAGRPDLVRRYVLGKFGFISEGHAVTPQWSDEVHLAMGLKPIPRLPVKMLWDWGHNPTCVITQVAPDGRWNVLDALVGENMGVEELIEQEVRAVWTERYAAGHHDLMHIYDPAGHTGEQTSIHRSPVMMVKRSLGGDLRPGPAKLDEGLEPLRAILSRAPGGIGMVQVDRHRAKPVWWALRGGWFYPKARTGLVSTVPRKNIHSHPGDAMRYGAAVLFPTGKLVKARSGFSGVGNQDASFFGKLRRDPLTQYGNLQRPVGIPT